MHSDVINVRSTYTWVFIYYILLMLYVVEVHVDSTINVIRLDNILTAITTSSVK